MPRHLSASARQAGPLAVLLALLLAHDTSLAGEATRTVRESGPVRVGQLAPTFGGWTLDGRLFSLRDWVETRPERPRGPIVVSFFATWCKPCRKGLPTLARVATSLKAEGVRALLVAHGQDAESVRPFVEELRLGLPVLLDPFTKVSARMGVTEALPRAFVLTPDGTVHTIFESEGDDFETVLRAALLAAAH